METGLSVKELRRKSLDIIENVFRMAESAGGGYVAQSLSSLEVITTLYHRTLKLDPKNPDWPQRDRFYRKHGLEPDQIADTILVRLTGSAGSLAAAQQTVEEAKKGWGGSF